MKRVSYKMSRLLGRLLAVHSDTCLHHEASTEQCACFKNATAMIGNIEMTLLCPTCTVDEESEYDHRIATAADERLCLTSDTEHSRARNAPLSTPI
eukprot:6177684-Pleurochrysis_carterae.AAC.2